MKNKGEKGERFARRRDEMFEYSGQGVRLEKSGKAYVYLEEDDEVEVPYEIGRFILFCLKLRKKEIEGHKISFTNSLFSKLINYSNCHRALLVALGFSFRDVLENEFGSRIIRKFFFGKPLGMIRLNRVWVEDLEKIINSKKRTFPLVINFFGPLYASKPEGELDARHSILVLGKSKKGKIIIFHKDGIGPDRPVELTSLDKVEETRGDSSKFATIVSYKTVKSYYNQIKRFANENR